mmetsp:Transcript_57659/g.160709  ORF Transcript_57659/g.160709 Transcript_57659/m.160709 type:complete len:218 (-) Transcript_57659:116-769(-)
MPRGRAAARELQNLGRLGAGLRTSIVAEGLASTHGGDASSSSPTACHGSTVSVRHRILEPSPPNSAPPPTRLARVGRDRAGSTTAHAEPPLLGAAWLRRPLRLRCRANCAEAFEVLQTVVDAALRAALGADELRGALTHLDVGAQRLLAEALEESRQRLTSQLWRSSDRRLTHRQIRTALNPIRRRPATRAAQPRRSTRDGRVSSRGVERPMAPLLS